MVDYSNKETSLSVETTVFNSPTAHRPVWSNCWWRIIWTCWQVTRFSCCPEEETWRVFWKGSRGRGGSSLWRRQMILLASLGLFAPDVITKRQVAANCTCCVWAYGRGQPVSRVLHGCCVSQFHRLPWNFARSVQYTLHFRQSLGQP